MEKSGYRCYKCGKRFLSRRQLALWGGHYWCDNCITADMAAKKKEQPLRVSAHFQRMMDTLLPDA